MEMKQFPDEYSRCFRPCFTLLNNFNIRYFVKSEPFLRKYRRFFYIIPLVLLFVASLMTHVAILLIRGQVTELAYMLPPVLVTIHATLKSIIIIPKSTEITVILRDLGHLWRTEFTKLQNEKKNKVLTRVNFINSVSYWVSIFGSVQYLLSPLLETLVRRYILKHDCELLLPIAVSFPFNPTENWPIYLAVYIYISYTMFILVFVYTGSELIMITLCALIGTEFIMLREDLVHVKPNKRVHSDDSSQSCCIKDFVKRHQKLIMISRRIDDVFNKLIFIDLLFVGITTCAFTFAGEFTRGPTYTINNYIAVVSSLCTVLCLCYYGELLTEASIRIGDTAYENLWYNASKEYKMAIFFIIRISQKSCRLTSLKYSAVSLNMFTKVVSTTWSYFSLLNSFYTVEETNTIPDNQQ